MFKSISTRSGLTALAIGALTLAGATGAAVDKAEAKDGWGKHGGGWGKHGHWGGHGHWHAHRRWGWGGPRIVYRAPFYVGAYGCYRAWRTIYVPGEGYIRAKTRVCG